MTDLEKHAEAILRAARKNPNRMHPSDLSEVLTACAALFDAGAVAMREKAVGVAWYPAYVQNISWDEPLIPGSPYDRGAYDAQQRIRALDPASLRGA